MKRLLAAAVSAGLVTMGAVASSAQADPAPSATPAITWGTCDNATLLIIGAECGFLTVPMDYAKPDGRKIKLAVSRTKHSSPDKKYQGVMLVNPGGPGGSGLALSVIGSLVPGEAGTTYDWIGFDPRGVGSSQPALTCDSTYAGYNRPPYVPATQAIEKTWLARTKGYAKACAAAGGPLLDHLKTVDSARDMESLRRALHVEKINYYGFSYGTYLGQVYATQYPNRVRRMVLDGVVNPGRVWYDSNLDQNIAFDKNIKIYFQWLAKYDSVYHLGKTRKAVEKLFYATQAGLVDRPAGGAIGPNELTDVFLQAGYYVFGWQDVANAFVALVKNNDASRIKALYDQQNTQAKGSDNGYSIYLSVQCTDAQWPTSWRRWKTDNNRVHRVAPFETWGNAWYNAPCLHWGGVAGTPVAVDGRKAPPLLMISETLDAATPFSGALEARKRFPKSVLVEGVGGTTHAGSLFGGTCVDGTIAAYLKDGTLPARAGANRSDRRCEPLPTPDPTAPAARTAPNALRLELQRAITNRYY